MEFREFTGKTIDDAIIEAATSLGVATSNLETQVVFKGSMGFLGIGAKPAVIKARPKNTETIDDILTDTMTEIKTEKKSDAEKPVKEKAPKTERTEKAPTVEKTEAPKEDAQPVVIDESIIDDTKEYLKKLFAAMELEADITVELDKDTRTLNIDVEGPEMGIIIGKRGQTLDSLQYLTSLVVNKHHDGYIRVKLDTENYRERRQQKLEELAHNIAHKVSRTKKSVDLEPMNPYERRIIHSALQDDPYVTTVSEGEEPYRHVVVKLKRTGRHHR